MRFKGILLVRRAITYMCAHENQRRMFRLGLRHPDRVVNRFKIISIFNHLGMPARRFEASGTIFCECDVGRSRKRDVVVVIKANQFAEIQMTGERGGLIRYAFH